PTTGLDPQSRRQLWSLIESFRAKGGTVLLTTHYMDEAERLCDNIAIVDHGQVIALGTSRQLIRSLGAEHVVEFALRDDNGDGNDAPWRALTGVLSARRDAGTWSLQTEAAHETVPALLSALADRGLAMSELRTHSPTLEDVFVSMTGRRLIDDQ
ncbi:MAG TPA: hypothetical protein VFG84_09430, partial [Gemmatimonadaceae bacterium]|nr:hypothetical protein [Gemmatimonadaceae bacterium]